MAARLLLRQGGLGSLKAVLLGARVSRGFASTAPLSAQSGKNEKGLPPSPTKQSPPKTVVEPEERATPTAAPLSQSLSPPGSSRSPGSRSRAAAGLHPGGCGLRTDEGGLSPLSRKTLLVFPQKDPSPLGTQGSDSEACRGGRHTADDPASSSSSSSSSDSESDEEREDLHAGSPVVSRGKGGLPGPDATHQFESTAPRVTVSAKEKTRAQKPRPDVTYPEKPRQPKEKGTRAEPVKGGKEASLRVATGGSHARGDRGEVLKQDATRERVWASLSSDEAGKESRTLPRENPPGRTRRGTGPAAPPLSRPEEAEAQAQPQGGRPDPPVLEPGRKLQEGALGKQVVESHSKAKEQILGEREPTRNRKADPVQHVDIAAGKTAGLPLAERPEEGESAAQAPEAQGDTQEASQAAAPAEPDDNTTYKNLQHHDYGLYTFLDLNLDLSKFRLPQPSSGRESPRH